MALNDIWHNLGNEVSFFTSETFENVPTSPGVYAWFYPLRIVTKDLDEFLKEITTVLSFDAVNYDEESGECAPVVEKFPFSWKSVELKAVLSLTFPSQPTLSRITKIWDRFTADDASFDKLREIIMKTTIFTPPLYVGKTARDLNVRCSEHRSGSAKESGGFHGRYKSFAENKGLPAREVNDLLFACVSTKTTDYEESDKLEDLVETLLKHFAQPTYSKL